MKNVLIWSFYGPFFPVFGQITEIYRLNLRIQYKCGKKLTRETLNTDNFHGVNPGLTQISKKEHFITKTSILMFARVLDATLLVRKNIDKIHLFHLELKNSYGELV